MTALRGGEALLDKLDAVQRSGSGWKARCPAHDDRAPSLSINEAPDGRVLLHCHAGCDANAVLAALGLDWADLAPERHNGTAPAEHRPPTVFEVRDLEGRLIAEHVREDLPGSGKKIWWRRNGRNGLDGLKPSALPLFGSEHLARLRRGALVIVTEGEKAAQAIQKLGIPAVGTVTGAAGVPCDASLQPLLRFLPVLWADSDPGGQRHMHAIAARLVALGCIPCWLNWPDAPPKGDAADFAAGGGTVEQLTEMLESVPPWDPASALAAAATAAVTTTSNQEPDWPAPLADEAFHGLAGELVRAWEPHTESDPAALLLQLLVGYGNVIGRGPYLSVEADHHYANEYVAIVGDSAKARKGTSWGYIRAAFEAVDPEWVQTRIHSGLSSGEGFVYAVRDAVTKVEALRDKGRPTGEYQEVVVDPGVTDKRLLVQEAELASTLKMLAREGSILSPALREAWDGRPLGTMTKTNPVRATDAHVSVVGHITIEELRRTLDATEAANGFANRFLFCCARRSKCLPEGGHLDPAALHPLYARLATAVTYGRRAGEVRRDAEARATWCEIYPQLSAALPGLLGGVTARAEAHVVRLSMLYALLDESSVITVDHLLAALAVWDYCLASARHIFGDATGDQVADTILRALRLNGDLDRTAISALFARNQSSARIGQALALLLRYGLARATTEETSGRGREVWVAA